MEKKIESSLLAAKYAAYIFVLWAVIMSGDFTIDAAVILFILIFAVDNIRLFYLESKNPVNARKSLYLQSLLIFLFVITDQGFLGNVLYVILIVESFLFYPRKLGDQIFISSVTGYIFGSALSLFLQNNLSGGSFMAVIGNTVFIFLVYVISYLSRRQSDEKARAEEALAELEKSRKELEKAHLLLLDHSKQREKMMLTEERNRLAREIHDTLGHTLTTVIIGIEAGKKLFKRYPERAYEEFEKSQEQAKKGLDEVRRSVKALLPRDLEEDGFVAALKGMEADFKEKGVGLELHIDKEAVVPKEYELAFFRIIQESVTNSIRHGGASLVTVKISVDKEMKALQLIIDDNGAGCEKIVEGNGLNGIRERMGKINGNVEFSSSPRGFTVEAKVAENLTSGEAV